MRTILLLAALLLSGCTTASRDMPARYANPVLDREFADPAALLAPDGYYYVYATQGSDGERMANIQVARSRDLVRWELLGDALAVKPGWASATQDFWAPHVSHHDGRYYLYYSAKPDAALADKTKGLCLAVAIAQQPHGPFVDSGRPLECGEGFVNIDPMAYDDPATGKRLLYWGSGFGPIKVRELAADRVSFAPGSTAMSLLHVDKTEDPANYQRLIEGAWVVRRRGWYYVLYSGDNCCGPKAHYAVMVARSRSATGPFETLRDATGAPASVILAQRDGWIAPGHNAVITDARGTHWMLYHAVDAKRPRAKPGDEVNTRRIMLLDRIEWQSGWPRVAGDGPSNGPQPAPAVRR